MQPPPWFRSGGPRFESSTMALKRAIGTSVTCQSTLRVCALPASSSAKCGRTSCGSNRACRIELPSWAEKNENSYTSGLGYPIFCATGTIRVWKSNGGTTALNWINKVNSGGCFISPSRFQFDLCFGCIIAIYLTYPEKKETERGAGVETTRPMTSRTREHTRETNHATEHAIYNSTIKQYELHKSITAGLYIQETRRRPITCQQFPGT